MKVTVVLGDYAAAADGKLTIVGAGWNILLPGVSPMGLGVIIEVPWTDTNRRISWKLSLQNADGVSTTVEGPMGPQPIEVMGQLEVGRPPGVPHGEPLVVPLVVNLAPLPLPVDQRFRWVFEIDGETQEQWQVGFRTVAQLGPPGQLALGG